MKKLITLLFAAGLVTAVSAQYGGRDRNDYRTYDNGYQSSPYSNNDQYQYDDQYNRNSQWNDREYQYDRERRRIARQRYEYEMMKRRQALYHRQRMYNSYPYGVYTRPTLQIRIGIGGHSRY
jgi:hypothetical protein